MVQRWGGPLRAWVAVVLAVLALAGGGCERVSREEPPPGAPAARLLATADFGATTLLDARVAPGSSVMRALRGATPVDTGYGGAFVSEMLGRSSDAAGQRDWFFYVDGVVAGVSARDVEVEDGDVIWWDHRYWGGQMDVPAVVGLWPRPFLGAGGPVAADPPLDAALRAAGVRLTRGESPWRVRVGAHAELLRREPAWRRASDDPGRAGLLATVAPEGVLLLDAEGRTREPVPGAEALVAAVASDGRPERGVLMVVAGRDAGAAAAAARRIAEDPGVLAGRFALVFDGAGTPLRAAGRAGP
jgi:Domain of unknown function (DUF4430)